MAAETCLVIATGTRGSSWVRQQQREILSPDITCVDNGATAACFFWWNSGCSAFAWSFGTPP
jgi:hypothetical protein